MEGISTRSWIPTYFFSGLEKFTADQLISWSRAERTLTAKQSFVHPENPTINGCSHIFVGWCRYRPDVSGPVCTVFYGDKAIDRSPCGTGTWRLAQWYAKGKLKPGQDFIHESIIGSKFIGRIEEV